MNQPKKKKKHKILPTQWQQDLWLLSIRCDGTGVVVDACVTSGPHGLLAEFPPSVSLYSFRFVIRHFSVVVVIFLHLSLCVAQTFIFLFFPIGECPYLFWGASSGSFTLIGRCLIYKVVFIFIVSVGTSEVKTPPSRPTHYHTNTNENAPFSFFGQQVFDLFFHGALTLAPDCVYW